MHYAVPLQQTRMMVIDNENDNNNNNIKQKI